MKVFLLAGLLAVALGIASLVAPIPHNEMRGIKAGDMTIGMMQTADRERVSPIISALLIAGGIALAVAGARTRVPGK